MYSKTAKKKAVEITGSRGKLVQPFRKSLPSHSFASALELDTFFEKGSRGDFV